MSEMKKRLNIEGPAPVNLKERAIGKEGVLLMCGLSVMFAIWSLVPTSCYDLSSELILRPSSIILDDLYAHCTLTRHKLGSIAALWCLPMSILSHNEALSFFFNTFGFWLFGRAIAPLIGSVGVVRVFFLTGMYGAVVAALSTKHPDTPILGASAGAYGVMGCCLFKRQSFEWRWLGILCLVPDLISTCMAFQAAYRIKSVLKYEGAHDFKWRKEFESDTTLCSNIELSDQNDVEKVQKEFLEDQPRISALSRQLPSNFGHLAGFLSGCSLGIGLSRGWRGCRMLIYRGHGIRGWGKPHMFN